SKAFLSFLLAFYSNGVFAHCLTDLQVKKGGKPAIIYFSAIPRDGIFEIDLSNSYTNESSIYAVSKKRVKLYLDSALLWHCCLGHISKKCIEKLQHDGLLNSTDIRAFENCVSCMSGKMARKPYTHQVEKAKDLLGLIHTDGCEALVKQDTLTNPDKLEPISIKCIFIGYPKETIGYSFYYPSENKVLVARNAKFLENSLITQEASGSLEDLEIIQEEDTHSSIDTSLNHEEDDLEIDEPQSDIVPIRRIDYEEAFSPVVDIRAIRILIAIAAYYYYEIWQIDVKTSFLNGYLNEEVYMEQPEKLKMSKSQGASTPAELKRMQNVPYALLVSCYTDAGYLTDADDLKSYTGYVFILNGGAVDWKSSKQSICTTSSAEAKYIVAFDASKEAVWLGNSFLGLVLFPQLKNP
nr:hypothetical protein [Tanacetum cinerariifolium]